jgi:hypothetical protein
MITSNAIETMNTLLGSNYQILANEQTDLVVLAKLPDEDLAAKNTSFNGEPPLNNQKQQRHKKEKTTDDYLFQFYLGSLTVVGLFVLFRMIQKN